MTTSDSTSAIIEGGSHTGSHLLHVEGYSATKELPNEESIQSESFAVGGRTWRIEFSPRGQGGTHTTHICLKLVLVHSNANDPYPTRARATFVLLDQAGNEVPAFTRRVEWDWYAHGGHRFIVLVEREAVEASSDLVVNDCLKIRCDVAVLIRSRKETRGPSTSSMVVPPPDLHSHLSHLLAARDGADVTFQVAGEAFSAHRCILAARSPVFKAELFGAMKESTSTGVSIRIGDMLPQVFNALLHFVYTDSLPPEMAAAGQEEAVLMAQHVLEAADRYAMQRLKLICEEKLCRCLDVNTIASTLVLAEQHSCHRLKEACFVFLKSSPLLSLQDVMASSPLLSLQDVMATSGFEHLIRCSPALLRELISKLATPWPYMKDSSSLPPSPPAAAAMPTFDTASAIVGANSTTGRHLLHIEAYSAAEAFRGWPTSMSNPFSIGGRAWCIWYFPHGSGDEAMDYISVFLILADNIPGPAYAEATFHLLDRAQKPVPAFTQTTGFNKYMRTIPGVFVCKHGIHNFIKREVLEAASSSEYLVDDCLKIRCDVTVKRRCYTKNRGRLPPSDLHRHLGELLVSKEGADVTFQVAAETFSAHRSILAARSRVLKAKLLGTTTAAACSGIIRIDDMLPRVFEAFLHFVYTDSLPASGQDHDDDGSMDYDHLLEAADRYDMQRLKLICEEKLCWRIEISTAATMLVFAQRHRCHRLRKACVDFLKCPQALKAVMATKGFERLVQSCPALLKELISKLAAR